MSSDGVDSPVSESAGHNRSPTNAIASVVTSLQKEFGNAIHGSQANSAAIVDCVSFPVVSRQVIRVLVPGSAVAAPSRRCYETRRLAPALLLAKA